ncbi:ankyrin and armadillo repeat-containing protein-like [Lingula anatina]|uniref:Ankyrin and armadillo repeat-containing protein-like n=1 Tax=Lingula anatina TaxID=7574 RepID=A0A2R2MK48_LINAN|nr:ankyrin and armadillo repeat-containing protein-like [Lingula anatina]|eukprot:XP_023930596.1 ankyrin and armadillo repeat-containing protein-like [Lingula anatina]
MQSLWDIKSFHIQKMTSLDDLVAGDAIAAAMQTNKYTASFFEKYDTYDTYELIACTHSHWFLSSEDLKVSVEMPLGLVKKMVPLGQNENQCLFLLPEDDMEGCDPLDFRELHQIIREMTIGMYVFGQLPSISLEANFDQSTSCQLPQAYVDTRLGQVLINIDYMMKALWHGVYFPKEKRTKFSEKWRKSLDVNSQGKPETKKPFITEFTSAGMLDITKDPDYSKAYEDMPEEDQNNVTVMEDKRFFMSHVDDILMQMTGYQNKVYQDRCTFLIEADWSVSSVIKLAEDVLDHDGYMRLKSRLRNQQIVIKQSLGNKIEIKRQLKLLKFISFMVPFLCAMRKRMKIPDLTRLLPNMTGDEVRTERELPPLILTNDYKCKNFGFHNQYFHLHGGIQFAYETSNPEPLPSAIQQETQALMDAAIAHNNKILDPDVPVTDFYPIPIKEIDGKRYYVFALDFETFHPVPPQKPKWVNVMSEKIRDLKMKRPPMSEHQVFEYFKKYFGYKKAMKCKTPQVGLREAARRGLVAAFHGLLRRCPIPRLSKPDDQGFYLAHHAAMFNNPHVLGWMIIQQLDVTQKRFDNFASVGLEVGEGTPGVSRANEGPTPLHLAARCGSLDAAACLMSMPFSNPLIHDSIGWAPVHHAAFFDNAPVLQLMIRRQPALLELPTKNDLRSPPLLLAAGAGALDCVICLINLQAKITACDSNKNNMVHLATLKLHTHVLEWLIKWDNKELPVWDLLVGMMKNEDIKKKDSAVKCMETLSTSDPLHWQSVLKAGGVSALVELLKLDNEEIQAVAAATLCNISEHEPIRHALTTAQAGPILIKLLSSPVDDIQSRAAIILSDLACVDNNQDSITDQGGIQPLVNLLDSVLEDVLVNAVNAIRVMCTNNNTNQSCVAECGGIEPLVEFLTVNSDILQAAASAAIAALCRGHRKNQDAVVAEGAVRPLVNLIKGRGNITVQVKAAAAVEALAENNPPSQHAFLELECPKVLTKFFKVWSVSVKEQGATALWALAGHTHRQQKFIAERIGVHQLIEMLLSGSEKLQFVGCRAVIALSRENMDNQSKMTNEGGISPLVRLLRSNNTTERVLRQVIETLGTLCVGVAHRNNKLVQKKIAEENGITILVKLLVKPPSPDIQVEVANTLGCIVLCNTENQELLKAETDFKFNLLLDLLVSKKMNIRLKAGMALAVFAFNNTPQQYNIREAGGIKYSCFKDLLFFLKSLVLKIGAFLLSSGGKIIKK